MPYYNYASRDVDGFSYLGNGIVAHSWFVYSNGPDLRPSSLIFQTAIDTDNFAMFINTIYDPTNGIISDGNIYRSGGRFHGPGARAGLLVSSGDNK